MSDWPTRERNLKAANEKCWKYRGHFQERGVVKIEESLVIELVSKKVKYERWNPEDLWVILQALL